MYATKGRHSAKVSSFHSALAADSFLFVPAVIETMRRVVAEIDPAA